MHSIKRLLVVVATIALLAVLVPSASAASPTEKAFHLSKTCASDFVCTVETSTFNAIPGDTDITYLYGADPFLAFPTINIKNGSTTGVCDWDQPAGTVMAICTFGTGTGRLSQFHLTVDVTATEDLSVWYWDGTYWFGGGH